MLCPVAHELLSDGENVDPLMQVRYQILLPDEMAPDPSLPRFVIPLGFLTIRTSRRYPDLFATEEPVTERIDYTIMLDVEGEATSLWLFCSRR